MPPQLTILYEDNHLLVLDKPTMLPTMGVASDEASLFKMAQQYIKSRYHKPGGVYLGVVSRLDRLASGVIVLARTSKAAERLNQQFRIGAAAKTYWAIIPGRLEQIQGRFKSWLVKDEPNRRMKVSLGPSRDHGAKLGELCYRRIAVHGELWLVEIQLLTGRKHQIRVQFSAANCPILGDQKYGSRQPFKAGIALHSQSLVITHPTLKTELAFQSTPPQCWNLERFGI